MAQSRKLFKFGYHKVLRDKNGKPVINTNGREVKHLLVSDDPGQVAEFNATNCFRTKGKK